MHICLDIVRFIIGGDTLPNVCSLLIALTNYWTGTLFHIHKDAFDLNVFSGPVDMNFFIMNSSYDF